MSNVLQVLQTITVSRLSFPILCYTQLFFKSLDLFPSNQLIIPDLRLFLELCDFSFIIVSDSFYMGLFSTEPNFVQLIQSLLNTFLSERIVLEFHVEKDFVTAFRSPKKPLINPHFHTRTNLLFLVDLLVQIPSFKSFGNIAQEMNLFRLFSKITK